MIDAPSCGSKVVVSLALAILVVAGVSLHSAAPGEAAPSSANYFLTISDIPGESLSRKDAIDVLSFSMNFSQTVPCGQLVIVKNIDKASAELVSTMLMGLTKPEAVLVAETILTD